VAASIHPTPEEKPAVLRPLFSLAEAIWPELKKMRGQRRLLGVGEVLALIYSAPLAAAGLAWLILETRFNELIIIWPFLIILAFLMILFRKLGFFMISEIRSGRYASTDGSMETMVLWTGVLLFGPQALWLAVVLSSVDFMSRWGAIFSPIDRWSLARNFTMYLASHLVGILAGLWVFRLLGGVIPLTDLSLSALFPGFAALLVHFIIQLLIWSGVLAYAIWTQKKLTEAGTLLPVLRFFFISMGLLHLAHPYSLLMAGLYTQHGTATFAIFMLGMILVAFLGRRLSWAAENNRQKSRQLEKLEVLGRAILAGPPDASNLPEILREHVQTMFPSGRVIIWIDPGEILACYPEDWSPPVSEISEWLQDKKGPSAFLMKEQLPWMEGSPARNATVLSPILEVDSQKPIGGVCLELFNLAQPWDNRALETLFPAIQSLAAQVASALHQAEVYAQALAYQRVSQELTLAGKIQASFLPDQLPSFSGWQLAVTLLPAKETSGDFFDLIPLSNGKLGILIADVTDKGVGAALYMALCRTLIRTYAIEFDEDPQPDVILFAANNRLLSDARADLFVTAFYGILDPETGNLTYANAGHNPPYLFRNGETIDVLPLYYTGMPMGIEEDNIWSQGSVEISPGDVLVLYTDGIPDSHNEEEVVFGEENLIESALASPELTADSIHESILEAVQQFSANAPQFDDITLMVLVRDLEELDLDSTSLDEREIPEHEDLDDGVPESDVPEDKVLDFEEIDGSD
jgi:serine phosphatase RsbU (regulator of sigma subunit)